LKTAGIRWPCTRNAHAIDWNSPDLGEDALVLKYTTPELLDECKAAGYKLTQSDDGKGKIGTLSLKESITEDVKWTNVFNMVSLGLPGAVIPAAGGGNAAEHRHRCTR